MDSKPKQRGRPTQVIRALLPGVFEHFFIPKKSAIKTLRGLNVPLDTNKVGDRATFLLQGLSKVVVSQQEAIEHVVRVYQAHLSGLREESKPVGSFLFLGPTGTGKSRLVEAAAHVLMQNPNALLRINCGEYQHSQEIAKLIGCPPGYLGHRLTHPLLSQHVLNAYHTQECRLSFVLFDEIEKASDALWSLLLGILDKATLTLGDNTKVNFNRTFVFLTSNLGAGSIAGILAPKLGLFAPKLHIGLAEYESRVSSHGFAAVRRHFPPEFIGRLDAVVSFGSLGPEALRQVLEIELQEIQNQVLSSAPETAFMLKVTDRAKQLLLSQGTSRLYNARHLKRAVQTLVVEPLSKLMVSKQVRTGDLLEIDAVDGSSRLQFQILEENLLVSYSKRPAYTVVSNANAREDSEKAPPAGAKTMAASAGQSLGGTKNSEDL